MPGLCLDRLVLISMGIISALVNSTLFVVGLAVIVLLIAFRDAAGVSAAGSLNIHHLPALSLHVSPGQINSTAQHLQDIDNKQQRFHWHSRKVLQEQQEQSPVQNDNGKAAHFIDYGSDGGCKDPGYSKSYADASLAWHSLDCECICSTQLRNLERIQQPH